MWARAYRGQDSLLRQRRWVDPASASIPFTYLLTSAALGQVMAQRGQTAESAQMFALTRSLARVAGLESSLMPAAPPRADSPKS